MPRNFFVYIVESPSAPDLYHGRSEGQRLADTLELDGIPCVTRTAINRAAFVAALKKGLPAAMKELKRVPILHVSAHGGKDGIALSNEETLDWSELRDLLIPINQSLQGMLLLCMSACEGYAGCLMAMREEEGPLPYGAIVGSTIAPTWSDTAVAYLTLYHLLSKMHSLAEAVAAMGVASGTGDTWGVNTAANVRQGYIEHLQKVQPEKAQAELEAVGDAADLPPDAKALEADDKSLT
jgi:hypothetical protein